jgi:hypothetical protein
MWKKIINQGEKVALELSRAERKSLLAGLVYLYERVEQEIRSTPPGVPVQISLADLDDIAGHFAGEANHVKTEKPAEILSGLFERIEDARSTIIERGGSRGRSSSSARTVCSLAGRTPCGDGARKWPAWPPVGGTTCRTRAIRVVGGLRAIPDPQNAKFATSIRRTWPRC